MLPKRRIPALLLVVMATCATPAWPQDTAWKTQTFPGLKCSVRFPYEFNALKTEKRGGGVVYSIASAPGEEYGGLVESYLFQRPIAKTAEGYLDFMVEDFPPKAVAKAQHHGLPARGVAQNGKNGLEWMWFVAVPEGKGYRVICLTFVFGNQDRATDEMKKAATAFFESLTILQTS